MDEPRRIDLAGVVNPMLERLTPEQRDKAMADMESGAAINQVIKRFISQWGLPDGANEDDLRDAWCDGLYRVELGRAYPAAYIRLCGQRWLSESRSFPTLEEFRTMLDATPLVD